MRYELLLIVALVAAAIAAPGDQNTTTDSARRPDGGSVLPNIENNDYIAKAKQMVVQTTETLQNQGTNLFGARVKTGAYSVAIAASWFIAWNPLYGIIAGAVSFLLLESHRLPYAAMWICIYPFVRKSKSVGYLVAAIAIATYVFQLG